MNAILDFVRAAFPWVLAGVAVAVLCVLHSKQQNREEARQDYSAEGMCLGMCLGVTMATTFGGMENLGAGPFAGNAGGYGHWRLPGKAAQASKLRCFSVN